MTQALENLKNLHFNGLLWPKYMFELSKYRKVMFDGTHDWYKVWRKTDLWFQKCHEEFDKFSPEHLKVSKLGLLWHLFVQSWKYMRLKFTGDLCVMTIKNDTTSDEELTCQFKIDMRNLTNFDRSTQKSKKLLHSNGLLLTKVCNVWAKKVQRSYVWWHWIFLENFKENWNDLSEMTWGISQIFTRACSKV